MRGVDVVTGKELHTRAVVELNFFPGMSRQYDDDTVDRNRRMSGREISKLCATIFLLSWHEIVIFHCICLPVFDIVFRAFPSDDRSSLSGRLQGILWRKILLKFSFPPLLHSVASNGSNPRIAYFFAFEWKRQQQQIFHRSKNVLKFRTKKCRN